MKLLIVVHFLLIFIASLTAQTKEESIISAFFNEHGVTGTFVLYDLKNDSLISNDYERAERSFLPASTFKIFNSLAALETGAVKDADEIIKWDSVSRGWEKWNQDLNLRNAFRYSAVWFYQELARRIGAERMQEFIDKTNYGNKNIGGGIDLFWLEGDLRITPLQQIHFLKKLYLNDLPFSQRSIDIVKEIMIRESNENYTLRAKTGWAARVQPQTGWYTGYVETKGNVYFFAINIDINKDEDAQYRELLTNLILKKLDITK